MPLHRPFRKISWDIAEEKRSCGRVDAITFLLIHDQQEVATPSDLEIFLRFGNGEPNSDQTEVHTSSPTLDVTRRNYTNPLAKSPSLKQTENGLLSPQLLLSIFLPLLLPLPGPIQAQSAQLLAKTSKWQVLAQAGRSGLISAILLRLRDLIVSGTAIILLSGAEIAKLVRAGPARWLLRLYGGSELQRVCTLSIRGWYRLQEN